MKMKGIDDKILSLIFYPLKYVEYHHGNNSIRKTIVYNKNSKKVIIILPQWMGRLWLYSRLIKKLQNKYTLVVYQLPNDLLNKDPHQVFKKFLEAKKDITKTVSALKSKGFKEFSILGTSLSAALVFMVANADKSFRKIIVGFAGSHLSKSFLESNQLLVSHIREKMQTNGTNLIKLGEYWKTLEPINNIKNIKGRKLYIYLAKNDKVIPYKYGLELLNKIKNEKIDFNLYTDNIYGHYIGGLKQLLFPDKIIKFLEA